MNEERNVRAKPNIFADPSSINTIEALENEVYKVFLLADEGVVRAMVAAIIANRMDLDPVWLLLVAGSSAGKTELLMSMSGLEFVHLISDLTVNTFASAQKKPGKETSLLLKMNNGVMMFKDFTSILAKNSEARAEIMKQLREVYDGTYVKRTGTGDDITWTGKIGAIAGCTEAVYRYTEEMSQMGDRFVMYSIEAPDRIQAARRAMNNTEGMREKREHLKMCFNHFINKVINELDDLETIMSIEAQEEFLFVADFAALARSAVLTNQKTGLVNFVPTPEMPMRIAAQLYTVGSALIAMNKVSNPSDSGELTDIERRILYKIAFDSIPRTRRDALVPLAKYMRGISTAGLATHLGLPSQSVLEYLTQLNALGICSRVKKSSNQGDMWIMKPEYRAIMVKLYDLDVNEGSLLAENFDSESSYEDERHDFFDSLAETSLDAL